MLEAIRVTGGGRDNLIQNNLLGGAAKQLIQADSGTAIVQGNTQLG